MKTPRTRSLTPSAQSTYSAWAPWQTLSSVAKFGGAFMTDPNTVGSVVPSMPSLGRRMAAQVPSNPEGYIVELGAGTGVITEALLKRGVPMNKLVSVDCSETMARMLRERYPELNVLVGNAAKLKELLEEHLDLNRHGVSHIVSGLPLRSLPKDLVHAIAHEVTKVLPRRGRFVQFTYNLRAQPHPALAHLRYSTASVVWCNLPPARVNIYTKE